MPISVDAATTPAPLPVRPPLNLAQDISFIDRLSPSLSLPSAHAGMESLLEERLASGHKSPPGHVSRLIAPPSLLPIFLRNYLQLIHRWASAITRTRPRSYWPHVFHPVFFTKTPSLGLGKAAWLRGRVCRCRTGPFLATPMLLAVCHQRPPKQVEYGASSELERDDW